ncbi:MAG: DUF4465 domain-containing protein [Fluviicola sp.]|nr:DUF4465 domain-containing protein [Fluviicola sp.]MBP6272395.1 DUF4465 domain-containing protein [Fluviicola sp.]
MKKIVVCLAICSAGLGFSQSVVTFEDLTLPPNTHYTGSDLLGGFTSNGVFFENTYDSNFGFWSGGFIYSNSNDTTTAGFTNDYSAITGVGANGGGIYAVNYYGNIDFISQKVVSSIALTNTTFAYLSMLNGDDFAKQFGDSLNANGENDGSNGEDFFRLRILGRDQNSTITDSVIVYLADYRFSDNSQDYILKEWLTVDLTALGAIQFLEFELSSSDVGSWGMNTPAYFALDNLVYGDLAIAENTTQLTVYPNPTTDVIHIGQQQGIATLMDVNGKELMQIDLAGNESISLAQFDAGTYFLVVSSNQQVYQTVVTKN